MGQNTTSNTLSLTPHTRATLRAYLSWIALLALLLSTFGAGRADADVTGCLIDENQAPIRRVWVTHWFVDYMTDEAGCVTIDADPWPGTNHLDVEVHRQNAVARVEGSHPNTRLVELREGETTVAWMAGGYDPVSAHIGILQSVREAYDHGLREFGPWQREFPNSTSRTSLSTIRIAWPSPIVVDLPYVEPASLAATAPTVHLRVVDYDDHQMHTHETGHALHFSKLSPARRVEIEAKYLAFLASPDPYHWFEKRTTPMIAYLEAFGCFTELYESTWGETPASSGPIRHQYFFEMIDGLLETNDVECGTGGVHRNVSGVDTEGALFLTLFHEFARQPAVGLDRVVTTFVECNTVEFLPYVDCMRDQFGSNSTIYAELVAAAARYGINLPDSGIGVPGSAEASDRFGDVVAHGDFDGDGYMDLAVGAPNEAIGSAKNAGAVSVIYGSSLGLIKEGSQTWSSASGGMRDPDVRGDYRGLSKISGVAAAYETFGAALASGDFDGDDYDDLAIGVPGQTVRGNAYAGYVTILYGSPIGLTSDRTQAFHQDVNLVAEIAETYDFFGQVLAAGDFNRDGRDDLAVGIPKEDVGKAVDAGAVQIFFGYHTTGLTGASSRLYTQNTSGIADTAESYDNFGQALAVGSFDSQAYDDLAIGAPFEDIGKFSDAGAVHALYGTSTGLTTSGSDYFTQDVSGINDSCESGDRYGYSLAAGDFNDDRRDDLAIGVPYEDLGKIADAGVVNVIYGASSGLSTTGDQLWSQNTSGIWSAAEKSDRFGWALTTGHFGFDDYEDLAIGVPYEDIGAVVDAGAVQVIHGSATRLRSTGDQGFSQDTSGVDGSAERADRFGDAVTAGDFDGDGQADLAIGVPMESLGSKTYSGMVNVIYSFNGVVIPVGDQVWHQDR